MIAQRILIVLLAVGSVLVLTRKLWARKKVGKKSCGGCGCCV